MAGPPSSAFSQLVIRYTGAALPNGAVTTHGFTTPTDPIGDVLAAIYDVGDALKSCLSTSVTILDITWKVGPVATGPSTVVPVGLSGDEVGPVSPPQVAYLVKLPVLGLSNRFAGRFYLPGVLEDEVSDAGAVSTTQRSKIQVSLDVMMSNMAAVGAEPRVFSTVSSDPRTVVSWATDLRVATQRRRLR